MASSEHYYSATPTSRVGFKHTYRKSDDFRDESNRPSTRDARSLSGSSKYGGTMGPPSIPAMPGGFNSDLKTLIQSRSHTPQHDLSSNGPHKVTRRSTDEYRERVEASEGRQAMVRDKIAKELKIKVGTENLLEALNNKPPKQVKDQRIRAEQELNGTNRKLVELQHELDREIQKSSTPITPPYKRMSSYFGRSPQKITQFTQESQPDLVNEPEEEDEISPSIVFTEVLQELEVEGLQPDYYIDRSNRLVDLLGKHASLKYDIAWSVFGGRVQLMLLSDNTDVVAAGYRLTRHAIADRKSLQIIRKLQTDAIVTLSMSKKGKSMLEKEQAIKFVRAFLDVEDGSEEVSPAVVRSLISVAECQEDNMHSLCLLTLAEIFNQNPSLVVASDGMTPLVESFAGGIFPAPEGLALGLINALDTAHRRKHLDGVRQLQAMFAPFTDPLVLNGDRSRLKICAQGISAALKTWPGFLALSANGGRPVRSLIESLVYPEPDARELVLDILFDVLRIKPPSWSTSFLAGRRLTTYGHVNQPAEPDIRRSYEAEIVDRSDLTLHFTGMLLITLLRSGLVPSLVSLIQYDQDSSMKRRCTMLVTEVLKLASRSLPRRWSSNMQVLGDLLTPSDVLGLDHVTLGASMVYQIDSINRTAYRTGNADQRHNHFDEVAVGQKAVERARYTSTMDTKLFLTAVTETGVPAHTGYVKWNWNLISDLIEGPLTNTKLLEETLRTSKFVKRLLGFYQPFKERFSMVRNNRANLRYVRIGCALVRSLSRTSVGVQYLSESKMMRQLAECLAQLDKHSGITSEKPLFNKHNMIDYLTSGYFNILGALSESVEGIQIMERWHMMNMFYNIVDLTNRDDLLKALLGNFDYSLDSHLRILLSKSLTFAQKEIRLFCTRLLRKYAVGRIRYSAGLQDPASSQWALKLVLTQLYDPDIEVCEVAVRILEEACDRSSHLEFIVKCRPTLDHLGEIGAPLLLRFLSISTGYRYLSGLDYIHQEMDDWFLGRNHTYVGQVEASLARAYLDPRAMSKDDNEDFDDSGLLPPHFYRELARTEEGCKLLSQSGHFYEFASTVKDFDLDDEDFETLTKIKSCLWAIGNIGSMEYGAIFLEESEVVKSIVRIAEGASTLSLRGTAIFVLGLISRTTHGVAMLMECGWEVTIDTAGKSVGLCYPQDLEGLCLKIPQKGSTISALPLQKSSRYKAAVLDNNAIHERILRLVVDMGNSVTYKKIAGELQLLRSRNMQAFADAELFKKTLTILASHHCRLPARQFVLDLFDKSVLQKLVLEDDEDQDENESMI